MNVAVRSWQRHEARSKYDGPDGLSIDEDQIQTGEVMGRPRKSTPMPQQHFDSVVTMLKVSALDRVLQIRTVTYEALKRLGVKRNLKKFVAKNPHGSTQFDTGTLIMWINGVLPVERVGRKATAEQKQAGKDARLCVAQLVAIDATCCARGD